MFNSSSSKKRSTSDDDLCEDGWDWSSDCEKDSKKNSCGCNVSINIFCNTCKKESDFSDGGFSDKDFQCMSKKEPVYSDEKCSVYVNVYCNS